MNINMTKNNFIQCGRNRYVNLNNANRIEWEIGERGFDVHVWYGRYEETYNLTEDEFRDFQEEFENNAL